METWNREEFYAEMWEQLLVKAVTESPCDVSPQHFQNS
jgi:hypothetical protein